MALYASLAVVPCVLAQKTESSKPLEPIPSAVNFDDYFVNRALRLEMFHLGDANNISMSLHEMYEEPVWPENRQGLLSPFPYGRCIAKIYDLESSKLICTRPFDTMFSEYITTEPARKGVKRVLETTVRCPMPKKPIRFVVEARTPRYVYETIFETTIDPDDYHIRRETISMRDETFEVQGSGDPANCVDIAFLAEGYTVEELPKFKSDVARFADFMFAQKPYSMLKNRFSVRGVFRASAERGTDEPRQKSFRNTALNSTYNIFDVDRYMLVESNHAMHRMAAQVPYDTIVVLVNTKRYGGGAICYDFCCSSADHETSEMVFLHEFGHSFAYLADEYVGNVAYSDMYPEGFEPVEPNITRELNRERIKWKALLSPRAVELPTSKLSSKEAKRLQIVGAFEGGGYVAKGIYRPEQACWMGSMDRDEGFCAVCADAIERMVRFYAPER
jgi:hypothetical protein